MLDNLPSTEEEIRRMLIEVRKEMQKLELQFFEEEESDPEDATEEDIAARKLQNEQLSYMKEFHCIPVSEDVLKLDFAEIREAQLATAGKLFDVITMDPPW